MDRQFAGRKTAHGCLVYAGAQATVDARLFYFASFGIPPSFSRAALAKQRGPGALSSRNVFPRGLEAGRPRSRRRSAARCPLRPLSGLADL